MQNAIADDSRRTASQVAAIGAITPALERLLAKHQSTLKAEGMERQIQSLTHWLEENHANCADTGVFPEDCHSCLADLCHRLKQVVEEKQRLEGEGGAPATKEQNEQNEELLSAVRRIEKILHANFTPRP
jgi:hypothetical protein